MPKQTKAVGDLFMAGVIAAREKLYERAARTRTAIVFLENGKIVSRIPRRRPVSPNARKNGV